MYPPQDEKAIKNHRQMHQIPEDKMACLCNMDTKEVEMAFNIMMETLDAD